jgi:hypothetical protein
VRLKYIELLHIDIDADADADADTVADFDYDEDVDYMVVVMDDHVNGVDGYDQNDWGDFHAAPLIPTFVIVQC